MRIGFIGCGNMATAMIRGILDSKIAEREELIASAKSEKTKEKIREELQIHLAENNRQTAQRSDVLFLAVKPMFYEEVAREIKTALHEGQIIVTIAPGKTLAWMEEQLGKGTKIVRSMPNTPAMVKEGMSALCKNAHVTEEELELVKRLFEGFGRAEEVPERLMDVVTGVAGSSPAYVYMFIEALADAGVADGMPRAQAYRFAAQAVLGSARMVLETGRHPGELKDMVCSPGGTTIEAVRVLEEKGMRSAVFEASKACVKKAGEM
ncbi:MAG: pyrroline-5-carboxylate reductase [Eubacteriales bacterium]|nr:pyrroline-5-carboxylate reductase [Eubacteriales bacterium]